MTSKSNSIQKNRKEVRDMSKKGNGGYPSGTSNPSGGGRDNGPRK